MKYWAYFAAKLAALGLILSAVRVLIAMCFPPRTTFWNHQQDPFAHDLTYTTVMMGFFLLMTGLIYLVIWDQRYRCRTCLRRLRMPLFAGSWPNSFLIGQPRREYICTYGHGTLQVPELDLTGPKNSAWQSNGDNIWKELESLETAGK